MFVLVQDYGRLLPINELHCHHKRIIDVPVIKWKDAKNISSQSISTKRWGKYIHDSNRALFFLNVIIIALSKCTPPPKSVYVRIQPYLIYFCVVFYTLMLCLLREWVPWLVKSIWPVSDHKRFSYSLYCISNIILKLFMGAKRHAAYTVRILLSKCLFLALLTIRRGRGGIFTSETIIIFGKSI